MIHIQGLGEEFKVNMDKPVVRLHIKPICPKCGWVMFYDEAFFCTKKDCSGFAVKYKAPTIELERIDAKEN